MPNADDEEGRPPTDEELREIGIDPEENRDKRENPRELPDILSNDGDGEESGESDSPDT